MGLHLKGLLLAKKVEIMEEFKKDKELVLHIIIDNKEFDIRYASSDFDLEPIDGMPTESTLDIEFLRETEIILRIKEEK